uniref:Amino acid transporter transmembrane domain-containing protein n=1 Tax=Loxodonta africana TaxID=9785 RepID=G3UA62_LOXAF
LQLGPLCLVATGLVATRCMGVLVKWALHICLRLYKPCKDCEDTVMHVLEASSSAWLWDHAHSWWSHKAPMHLINACYGFQAFSFVFLLELYSQFLHEFRSLVAKFLLSFTKGLQPSMALILSLSPVPSLGMSCCLRPLWETKFFPHREKVSFMVTIFPGFLCQKTPDPSSLPLVGNWKTQPLFLRMAFFAFKGVGLLFCFTSLHQDQAQFPLILYWGLSMITILYISCGALGYLKIGATTEAGITLHLSNCWWLHFRAVKLLYLSGICLTYPLQSYMPAEIIVPFAFPRCRSFCYLIMELYTCEYLTCKVCPMAILIPCLDLVLSLEGPVSSSTLALIILLFLETTYYSADMNPISTISKDALSSILGFVGFMVGTYLALVKLNQPGDSVIFPNSTLA